MKYFAILFALLALPMHAQHSVSGTFSPATDYTYAFLYHATPTSTDYIDRSPIDEEGNFNIVLDSSATAGMYKIVYALPPEEHNFDFIYNGKESISLTLSSEKGLAFSDSNENKLWSSYTNSIEMINRTISNYYTQNSTDKKAFNDIFKTLRETQEAFEEASKGTMAATFIKANKPYIPDSYEDISTYSSNLKRTFLSHIDFNDYLLQSSDFLVDRVLAYVFGMTENNTNANYKNDVDTVFEKLSTTQTEIQVMLLQLVWNRFKSMDNVELANYVSDNYLMRLAKEGNYVALIEELNAFRRNQIGNIAQNFELTVSKKGRHISTSLHDLDGAENYLIIFWSSTCGHCLDELPKVKTLLSSKSTIKVIAVGLEDDKENWEKTIIDYPDFIHVLGLGKWDNPISNNYGVKATPTYVLLDKHKTILAKPYDYEALDKALN